jgi:hypothetical protein
LCDKKGHYASDCHSAKDFQKFLQKRKRNSNEQKDEKQDGNWSDTSYMVNEVGETTYGNAAALDSGCSSHLLPENQIPIGMSIDNSSRSIVNTAKSGETMTSLGRIHAGKLENTLVMNNKDLKHGLVSVSALDRTGHTITFSNGAAQIVDRDGELIGTGRLSSSNLYEIDINTLIRSD